AGTETANLPMTTVADGAGWKATATVNGLFKPKPSTTVDWRWALSSDTTFTHAITGPQVNITNYSVDLSNIAAGCSKASDKLFPLATLTGHKFKDINANGAKDGNDGTSGLGGFVFTLHQNAFDGSAV